MVNEVTDNKDNVSHNNTTIPKKPISAQQSKADLTIQQEAQRVLSQQKNSQVNIPTQEPLVPYKRKPEDSIYIAKNMDNVKTNLKNTMLSKLDPNVRWNYCTFPDGVDEKAAIDKMRNFIEDDAKFNSFYNELKSVLENIVDADVRSIGTGQETETAKKFLKIINELEKEGFYNVGGRNINFWSGTEGREAAHAAKDECSDSDIPLISVLFDIAASIQEKENKEDRHVLYSLLPDVISAVYATQAANKGHVSVYMSNDKVGSEPEGCLQQGNNFWNAELPTLQRLVHAGKLKNINVSFYNSQSKTWSTPIDINSPESEQIPVRRRLAVTMNTLDAALTSAIKSNTDPFATPSRGLLDFSENFLKNGMSKSEYQKFCSDAKARPQTTLGNLRKVANKWHQTVNEGHDFKSIVGRPFDPKNSSLAEKVIYRNVIRSLHEGRVHDVIEGIEALSAMHARGEMDKETYKKTLEFVKYRINAILTDNKMHLTINQKKELKFALEQIIKLESAAIARGDLAG